MGVFHTLVPQDGKPLLVDETCWAALLMSYKSLLLKANSGTRQCKVEIASESKETGPLFSHESCAIDFDPGMIYRLGESLLTNHFIKLVHIISLFERETIPQIYVYIYMYIYVYVCIIYIIYILNPINIQIRESSQMFIPT